MKPSDIGIFSPMHFVGIFDHAEAEQAATIMIWTLAANGDEWRPTTGTEVAQYVRDRVAQTEPRPQWSENPFFCPSIHDLVARGYAQWLDFVRVEFTEAGLERLRTSRYNKAREG